MSITELTKSFSLSELRKMSHGEGMRVAVIDSGIDATHPDLHGQVKEAYFLDSEKETMPRFTQDTVNKNNDYTVHGTAAAGIIHDIAPKADLIDVRLLNASNTCTPADLVDAIHFTLDLDVQLVNMSLSTISPKQSAELFAICERAYYKGVILIVSKHNHHPHGYPARFSNVISVNRFPKKEKARQDVKYALENSIEYRAPGTEIKCLAPNNEYALHTGTSFATPAVTGYATLIRSLYPNITPFEMKSVLKEI